MSTIGNKSILLAALGTILTAPREAEAIVPPMQKHLDFSKVDNCLPRTREQKLASIGLTVNSPEEVKKVKNSYGLKPPSNNLNPQSRECQRRLRQQQRQAAKKALASTSVK